MPRTHPLYAPEYRRRIIELARAGRSIDQLAREFEPSANAIRQWVKQASLDEGYFPPPVMQVEIPKMKGGTRKLGVPSCRIELPRRWSSS
jgi:transposase-like protein